MGKNLGFEQDGKGEYFIRPVLILKKFNRDTFWGIGLTTKEKKGKFYFKFFLKDNGKINFAVLSQIRLFDQKRLLNKIGYIEKEDFEKIKLKVRDFLS